MTDIHYAFIIVYIVFAIGALAVSIGMFTDKLEGDRQTGAIGMLTFWAWPVWIAIFAIYGVWHLIKIAVGKEY